jgi:hypothetical protein
MGGYSYELLLKDVCWARGVESESEEEKSPSSSILHFFGPFGKREAMERI